MTAPTGPFGPVGPGGGRWCGQAGHERYECTHDKRLGGQCHEAAVRGTDTCDGHGGKPREVLKAEGAATMAAFEAMTLAERLDPSQRRHPGEVLLDAVQNVDALAMQVRGEVVGGDVSPESMARLVETSKMAASLARLALDSDAQDRHVRALERRAGDQAQGVEAFLEVFVSELGLEWGGELVRGALVRALETVEVPA